MEASGTTTKCEWQQSHESDVFPRMTNAAAARAPLNTEVVVHHVVHHDALAASH